jgi:hypothetical protein
VVVAVVAFQAASLGWLWLAARGRRKAETAVAELVS